MRSCVTSVLSKILGDVMMKFSGRYQLYAGKEDGSKRFITEFKNLILNSGLNALASGSTSLVTTCQVGTGLTEPNPTDTTLTNRLTSTTSVSVPESNNITNNNPYITTFSKTFRFPVGAITADITEIGIGWSTSGSLFSKSLIKDMEGNPTKIRVFSDEFLDIVYMVDIQPPSDIPFSANINGQEVTGIIRPMAANDPSKWALLGVMPDTLSVSRAYTGNIGSVTALPSGSSAAATSVTISAYTNGTYYRDITLRWDDTAANWPEGIKSMTLGSTSSLAKFGFQIQFDAPIVKNNTESVRLTLRLNFSNGV